MMEIIFQYSAPKITGDAMANANAVTLTGTGASDNTVNVYDGGKLIGTTKSDALSVSGVSQRGIGSWGSQLHARNIDTAGSSSQCRLLVLSPSNRSPICGPPLRQLYSHVTLYGVSSFGPETKLHGLCSGQYGRIERQSPPFHRREDV